MKNFHSKPKNVHCLYENPKVKPLTKYRARKRTEKEIGEGMFPMEFIKSLEDISINEAKEKAISLVQQSNALDINKYKAVDAISNTYNINNLLITLANFNLAFSGYYC